MVNSSEIVAAAASCPIQVATFAANDRAGRERMHTAAVNDALLSLSKTKLSTPPSLSSSPQTSDHQKSQTLGSVVWLVMSAAIRLAKMSCRRCVKWACNETTSAELVSSPVFSLGCRAKRRRRGHHLLCDSFHFLSFNSAFFIFPFSSSSSDCAALSTRRRT